MKRITPLFLSLVFASGTVACGKNSDAPTNSQAQLPPTSVAAGTTFEVSLPEEISTGKNQDRDRLILPVKSPLVGANPILKGAKVEGHLENVVKAARGRKAKLHLVFDQIVLKNGVAQPLEASLVNTKVESKTKGQFLKNVGIIAVGTTAGHFLGKKMGKKYGGLTGAAAATAFVLASPGGEVVLKKGTELELKLKQPIDLARSGT
ncbi:hypothetical protein [Altericista sp. CCNU0014]|uniref:hypothetical protein n=1 Tax=Altericista sp. CCNU0014 TaxID=3082949 RepID=UPI00384F9DDE